MTRLGRIILPLAFFLFIGFTIYSTVDLRKFTCEVCMEFEGEEACATVSASTREEALRTATDNACGRLASGMAAQFRCTRQQPLRVSWKP